MEHLQEHEEILVSEPMDVQEDVQEHDIPGFMSVEQMEDELVNHHDALANANANANNNTNVGQADKKPGDKPGYESLDDRMGASPFNEGTTLLFQFNDSSYRVGALHITTKEDFN